MRILANSCAIAIITAWVTCNTKKVDIAFECQSPHSGSKVRFALQELIQKFLFINLPTLLSYACRLSAFHSLSAVQVCVYRPSRWEKRPDYRPGHLYLLFYLYLVIVPYGTAVRVLVQAK